MRRSREELMDDIEVQKYLDFVLGGYYDVDVELADLEQNWLESKDMHGDGEYVVNSGDCIIMDGLTELESADLYDTLMGTLQQIKEERIG